MAFSPFLLWKWAAATNLSKNLRLDLFKSRNEVLIEIYHLYAIPQLKMGNYQIYILGCASGQSQWILKKRLILRRR